VLKTNAVGIKAGKMIKKTEMSIRMHNG